MWPQVVDHNSPQFGHRKEFIPPKEGIHCGIVRLKMSSAYSRPPVSLSTGLS